MPTGNNDPQSVFEILRGMREDLTKYVGTIDSDHAYIHQGLAFTYAKVVTLGNGATKACILKTPAASTGKYIHWRPLSVSSANAGILVEFNESVEYTGGSDETDDVWNRNRNLDPTIRPTASLVDGTVVITDAGTALSKAQFGAGGRPNRASGGDGGADEEIVLKPSTDYMIRITNQGTSDNVVTIALFWYEEAGYASN